MTFDLIIGNCDLNLYTRFNRDACNLLDDFRGRVQIDNSLVDPHLEAIPSL